jgi:hypothetical protein
MPNSAEVVTSVVPGSKMLYVKLFVDVHKYLADAL